MTKLFILLAFVFHVAKSEVYYVTFVKGNVKLQGAKANLKVGDKLGDNDQLIFADQSSKISCISPVKGRFDILGSNAKKKVQMEWVAILKDVLLPASSKAQLSTRSMGEENNDPEQIFRNPNEDNKVLLVENEAIKIDSKYVLDITHFFFVQYKQMGKEVLKKVPVSNGGLSFGRSLFGKEDGNTSSPDELSSVNLCYQGSGTSKEIVKFIPVIISLPEFKEQVLLLRANLKKKNKEEVNKEIYNHFLNNYGYINASRLEKMMDKV